MATSTDYTIGGSNLSPRGSGVHYEDAERALLAVDKEEYRDEPDTPRLPTPVGSSGFRRKPFSFCAKAISVAPWVLVGMILAWMMSAFFYQVKPFKADITILKPQGDGKEPQQMHNDTLPSEPTPVIVTDKDGNTRWTVSIPASREFPLKPEEYEDLCAKTHVVSHHLDEEVHNGPGHYPYYHIDENFMDIADAEDQGLLPTNPVLKYSSHWTTGKDTGNAMADASGYCRKTLTFVLESRDPGLGPMLMQMWAAYGLAQQEGRAFFINDRGWSYGRYSDYFQPPPAPGCLQPPENHMLSCPRHAAHLIVSSGTTNRIFGHQFTAEFEDPKKMGVERQINIFGLMRVGYEALYHLADSDQSYADQRIKEVNNKVREHGGIEVGVHIRHGDKHPLEFAFEKSYIPLDRYIQVAWKQAESAHKEAVNSRNAVYKNLHSSKMILASDDPLVYWSDEMALAMPAQDRVELGAEPPLEPTSTNDESSPWEGGFTAATFWQLGAPPKPKPKPVHGYSAKNPKRYERRNSAPDNIVRDLSGDVRVPPSTEALKLRAHVARSYFLDLAVVGQTDRIVCTTSSAGCRVLAVMMGWEKAIEQKHWVNIDGQWDWTGIKW